MRSGSGQSWYDFSKVALPTKISFIDPAEYPKVPIYSLLEAAAHGRTGIDQRFIRAIVDRGAAAVPELLRFALEDHSDDPVNLEEDLISIFRHLRAPEALDLYVRCIRDNFDEVSDEIIDCIVPLGERALEPMLQLYEEAGEERGSDIAFILASLGVRDPRILGILIDRLEYDAGDAALALSIYRDPAAIPALERILAEIPESDVPLRREVQDAIESSGESKRLDIEVEPEPFDIWDLYPEESGPPVEDLTEPDLLEMLGSTAPSYRREAAFGLRNRSEYSKQARELLLKTAKSDPAAEVRGAALEALGELVEEPPVRKLLRSVLDDEAASLVERTSALVGLCQQTSDPHIVKAMKRFCDQPETRAKALEAMWRSFDKQFAEVFPKYLKDPAPEVRRAAIWGIGYLGSGSYAGELSKLFDDEEFRADAIFAYSLNVPAEISHGRMPGLFKRINDAAGGLDYIEAELAQTALDQRLMLHGLEPYFYDLGVDTADDDEEEEAPVAQPVAAKVGRNDPCPCGSGKKYKKCHGA